MSLKFLIFIFPIFIFPVICFTQENIGVDERGAGLPDTSITDTEGLDMKNKNTLRVLFSGNPGRAALYSLIFPGAGQAYNKKYWKIPLIYGALAGAGYYYYDINKKYKELKSLYQNDVLTHPNQSSNYFPYYLTQKKAREQAIFIIVGVHLFNSLEAYIDRHLIDFDTDENLSMEFKITPDPFSGAGISFYYTLK